MTENAAKFISPITFETLTSRKCITDTFDRNHPIEVEHISLAKKADLAIIAPATANIIAKMAYGIADDMLSTTLLACTCPVLVSPAMNTRMYEHPATQANLAVLKERGVKIIEPSSGHLACGDEGKGKLPDPAVLVDSILLEIACEKDLAGKNHRPCSRPSRRRGNTGVRACLPHSSRRSEAGPDHIRARSV